ncbi:pantoate--beta-alanine ligase [Sphingobium sp. CR28]|uniref:pantoate--beta-alanine ligase n=1 Tax=Sphingobium sp. CR28 TaxID=3400272 RepID=UPI003FED8D2B
MQTFREIDELRAGMTALRAGGERIALVPTMGALHAGHMALVAEARRRAAHVVVSIFVNPTQFAPNEDFDAYPRREASDAALLRENGVSALWAPGVTVMYPQGFASSIHVGGVTEGLDGAARPGHFEGVATVVAKLFGQVKPDVACFGEKDYQQLAMIRRMATDLDMGIEIVGVPTEREADGLALSSRNAYLSADERARAVALPRALGAAAKAIEAGAAVDATLADARAALITAGFGSVDYVALCDADSLAPVTRLERPARLLAAARIGATRLIDNIPVGAGLAS